MRTSFESKPEPNPRILSQVLSLSSESSASTFVVAITGPDCAGKSTAAKRLSKDLKARGYEVSILEVDSYIRPRRKRSGLPNEAENYYREGFDFDELLLDLETLKSQSNRASSHDKQIIIVEGVFLLKSDLKSNWDTSVWLEIPENEIVERGSHRDAEFFGSEQKAREIYLDRIIPAQRIHRQLDKPENNATVTYPFAQ
jgi:uridine kinase